MVNPKLATSELQPGRLIADRHRLERAVARTEIGVLYDAIETWSGREVAIEVASAIREPEARARLTRDAMMAQRLEGPHVLRVLEVGSLPDGAPYVVREPAIASLATEIHARGHVSLDRAVAWTLEACEAIAEAHAIGMSHGDIRPDTVFLARDGRGQLIVKVAWTSAAKSAGVGREEMQADVGALGGLLRALATGMLDPNGVDRAPTLPSPIVHAIARALAFEASEQLQDVAQLARLLAPYAPGHPSARNVSLLLAHAGISSAPPGGVRSSRERTGDDWFDPDSRRARESREGGRRFVPPLVALAILGVTAVGTGYLLRTGELPQPVVTTTPVGAFTEREAMTHLGRADRLDDLASTARDTEAEPAEESVRLASDVTTEGIVTRSAPVAAMAGATGATSAVPPPAPSANGAPPEASGPESSE